MKYRFLTVIMAVLLLATSSVYPQSSNNKLLEHRNQKDEFTIIVIRDHTMYKTAKRKALEKGAELAKKYGYKSFDIESEDQAEVILGKQNWPSAWDFPQNLYQEEIIQKGYNRDRTLQGSRRDYRIHSALKIKIKCYFSEDKGSQKVCNIIKC
ncbi:MAG: hypothetical protein KR126chlam4_00945 [Candidatus Anoxychlamydiales bacterium]|nr:hypothetical protein [Candidatus Anoxychlamydiales bacterium]HEU64428.1 hypothetical protein [Chlamydiota bacterium]